MPGGSRRRCRDRLKRLRGERRRTRWVRAVSPDNIEGVCVCMHSCEITIMYSIVCLCVPVCENAIFFRFFSVHQVTVCVSFYKSVVQSIHCMKH